jgi:hypothetical protein
LSQHEASVERQGKCRSSTELLCPSAQPEMAGVVAFGVVAGSAAAPVINYLAEPLAATQALLGLAAPVEPTEVFRLAAPCAESGCQHFDGASCQLAARLVSVPLPLKRLPRCAIRRSCRWWHEHGRAACERCPNVVTRDYLPTEQLRMAAPPTPTTDRSSANPVGAEQ